MLNAHNFRLSLHDAHWLNPDVRILVACSGGADSVALLNLLGSVKELTLGVIHINHGLRGADAERDAEFVRSLAQALGYPFFLERIDVKTHALNHDFSEEESGSILRNECFLQIAQQEGYNYVATGQHQDDQLETLAMHLLSGTGIKGLTGIASQRHILIRPLLGFTRQDIRRYLQANALAYIEDASNTDPRYFRNHIRHELLHPESRLRTASLEHSLLQMREAAFQLQSLIEKSLQYIDNTDVMMACSHNISLGLDRLPDYFAPVKKEIFDRAFQFITQSRQGISAKHFAMVEGLLSKRICGRSVQLSRGVSVVLNRKTITLLKASALTWEPTHLKDGNLSIQGMVSISSESNDVRANIHSPLYFWTCPNTAYVFRMAKPSDRLIIDEVGRSQKVAALLQGAHVAPFAKPFFPVLVDESDQVIWIPGLRTAWEARIALSENDGWELRHCYVAQFEKGLFE